MVTPAGLEPGQIVQGWVARSQHAMYGDLTCSLHTVNNFHSFVIIKRMYVFVSEVATVSKNFKINLEGQNYVHFYVILSRNVKIFGIMASLEQNGKK